MRYFSVKKKIGNNYDHSLNTPLKPFGPVFLGARFSMATNVRGGNLHLDQLLILNVPGAVQVRRLENRPLTGFRPVCSGPRLPWFPLARPALPRVPDTAGSAPCPDLGASAVPCPCSQWAWEDSWKTSTRQHGQQPLNCPCRLYSCQYISTPEFRCL